VQNDIKNSSCELHQISPLKIAMSAKLYQSPQSSIYQGKPNLVQWCKNGAKLVQIAPVQVCWCNGANAFM
jgi:hypothetical protein